MENKRLFFIAKIALLVIVGCVELSALPTSRTAGASRSATNRAASRSTASGSTASRSTASGSTASGSTASGSTASGSTASGSTAVSVDIKPVIEQLRLSNTATDFGGKIKNLIDATNSLRGLANTANLSESSKKDIRDLIMTTASGNFNMIIGKDGGKDFNSSLKRDLNAIITTVSGWGVDVQTYATTWGIR